MENLVKQYVGNDGRMKVKLVNKFGVESEEDVAELVAKTFIGMPKKGQTICFKDGNIKNCAADNLYWK